MDVEGGKLSRGPMMAITVLMLVGTAVNLLIYTLAIAQVWLWLSIPAFAATVYLIVVHWHVYRHIILKPAE